MDTIRLTRDEALSMVGVPSQQRYNRFVGSAVEQLKLGGSIEVAMVYAQLAQAEATYLGIEP